MTVLLDSERSDGAPTYPGRAIIDCGAIADNLTHLRTYAPTAMQMAVVKADAYGHGLVPVALAALRAGANWLGVAQVAEALTLRAALDQAGIARHDAPILAWIGAPGTNWAQAIDADIDLSVSWVWDLSEISAAARSVGRPARIHLKIDTGMARAGATPQALPALATAIHTAQESGDIELIGVWSHFSCADDPSEEAMVSTRSHLEIFHDALATLAKLGLSPRLRHLAATSGLLWHPEAHFDMVRIGIGMYGLSPNAERASSGDLGLRPAMRLESPLTSVKKVRADQAVSYGGTWRTPNERWLGLIPMGYADGILRAASNVGPVTVLAEHGPITTHVVGRVCMDQIIIDLGPAAADPSQLTRPAHPGDIAVIFGDSSTERIPSADQWAQAADTINYEIVSRIGQRIPRHYTNAAPTKSAS